jgi:MFS family permease
MADTPRAMSAADIAEWRNGWRVALGAGIGMGTGVSLYLYVASIFIGPISEEFGWSRGAISFGSMMSFLTGAVTLPILGRYLDRLGFRRVAIVCCFGLASVYALNALQTGVYEIYIAMMIAGGVFGGGTSSIIYTRPVIASFARQRGLALGIATAGTSIAAMIAPPLLMYVITEYGWRPGFFALAALTALIGLPLALALIGKAKEAAAHASDDVDDAPVNVPDVTLREAVKRGRFWLLVLAIACINIPGSGVLGQLAPLVSDTGLNDGDVAIVMSIYAAGLLVGRLDHRLFARSLSAAMGGRDHDVGAGDWHCAVDDPRAFVCIGGARGGADRRAARRGGRSLRVFHQPQFWLEALRLDLWRDRDGGRDLDGDCVGVVREDSRRDGIVRSRAADWRGVVLCWRAGVCVDWTEAAAGAGGCNRVARASARHLPREGEG